LGLKAALDPATLKVILVSSRKNHRNVKIYVGVASGTVGFDKVIGVNPFVQVMGSDHLGKYLANQRIEILYIQN
jgi:hypothetical protein